MTTWLDRMPQKTASLRLKRALDVVGAAAGLGLLGPAIAGTAAITAWKHGWPPWFTQVRPGLHGEPFTLIKLRTMTAERDQHGELLPDAERLTAWGRWLRSTSLDELPELWNVLRGDMSLVGPRPLLVRYLDRYSAEQARRHEVPPGITGWAQVRGRNALSWDEKLALDVWYVDHRSLALDVRILVETVGTVLGRRGISAEGDATMPEFMGTR